MQFLDDIHEQIYLCRCWLHVESVGLFWQQECSQSGVTVAPTLVSPPLSQFRILPSASWELNKSYQLSLFNLLFFDRTWLHQAETAHHCPADRNLLWMWRVLSYRHDSLQSAVQWNLWRIQSLLNMWISSALQTRCSSISSVSQK